MQDRTRDPDGKASRDPLANPYAPPADPAASSNGAERTARSYEGERRSVLVVFALSCVTLGIYPAIWYLCRARFFDGLHAGRKVGRLPWIQVALLVGILAGRIAGSAALNETVGGLRLAYDIGTLVVSFRIARVLRNDLARTGRLVHVSGAGVFFFGCLYLQHVINEAAAAPARRRK
jgi:hypothetical protein